MDITGICAEVIRLAPKPGAEARLLEIRDPMVAEYRKEFPAFVECRLLVTGDGPWVDLWWWKTKADAEAALAEKERTPHFLEWETLVDVIAFDWAQTVSAHA